MPSKTAYVNTSAYVNLVEEVEKRAIHAPATVAPLTDARDVGNRDQTRGSSELSESIARVRNEVNEVKETRVIKVSKPKSTAGPGVESLDSTAANGARTVSEAPPRGHNAVDIRLSGSYEQSDPLQPAVYDGGHLVNPPALPGRPSLRNAVGRVGGVNSSRINSGEPASASASVSTGSASVSTGSASVSTGASARLQNQALGKGKGESAAAARTISVVDANNNTVLYSIPVRERVANKQTNMAPSHVSAAAAAATAVTPPTTSQHSVSGTTALSAELYDYVAADEVGIGEPATPPTRTAEAGGGLGGGLGSVRSSSSTIADDSRWFGVLPNTQQEQLQQGFGDTIGDGGGINGNVIQQGSVRGGYENFDAVDGPGNAILLDPSSGAVRVSEASLLRAVSSTGKHASSTDTNTMHGAADSIINTDGSSAGIGGSDGSGSGPTLPPRRYNGAGAGAGTHMFASGGLYLVSKTQLRAISLLLAVMLVLIIVLAALLSRKEKSCYGIGGDGGANVTYVATPPLPQIALTTQSARF